MKKNKLLDKLFLIIVSIQTILMGILFIIQILRIYFGNDETFTREICREYILQILPIIIIWIIIIFISYFYFRAKDDLNKNITKITNINKLNNLQRICPDYSNNELNEEYTLLNKENRNRKIASLINIIILIICSIMGLCYLLNVKHFESSGDLTAQAIKMAIHLSPWVIISFISLIGCTLYEEFSAKKSIDLIKVIIKSDGKKISNFSLDKKVSLKINITRVVVLSVAIVFIVTGIINGGANDVLQKAINICTECIGLG